MDWLLKLLGVVAWPLAAIVISQIFRRDIIQALGHVGRFKYRDLEVTFRQDLSRAEELARAIPASPSPKQDAPKDAVLLEVEPGTGDDLGGQLLLPPSSPTMPPIVGLMGPVEVAPEGPGEIIEGGWDRVAKALARASTNPGDRKGAGPSDPDAALAFLVERGNLSSAEALLVKLVRNLRERARLDQHSPTLEEARRFAGLASNVARLIEGRA